MKLGHLKTLVHPDTGKTVRMGRRRPTARPPALRLGNYLRRDLAPAPLALHDDLASPGIDTKALLENVLANDTLGDCTAAGAGHAEDIWNPGSPVTAQQAIAFYSATTGYIPGQPNTDQGGDEVTVLNYWRDKGFYGNGTGRIASYATVNGADPTECKTAILQADVLYFGVELPDAWINPFPSASGFVWDVAGDPDPSNGHCFIGYGYNENGVFIDTWGIFGLMTWAAVARYATSQSSGELYMVMKQATAQHKIASGFAYAEFDAHVAALA